MINESKTHQSVARAMAALECLAARGGQARLSEIAAALELNRSTTHGLLNTLAALGYVNRIGRIYALGLRLRELAQALSDADERLRLAAAPLVAKLAQESGETSYLAAPCGTREYLYLDAVESERRRHVSSPRGRREGLTTSAIGRIFLAYDLDLARSLRKVGLISPSLQRDIETIAERGYALDLEEAEPGLNCFAVPLRANGQVVAALGASGPASRLTPERMTAIVAGLSGPEFDIGKL